MDNSLEIPEDQIPAVLIDDIKNNLRGQYQGSRLTRDQIIDIARKDNLQDLFIAELRRARLNGDVRERVVIGYKRLIAELKDEIDVIDGKEGTLDKTAVVLSVSSTGAGLLMLAKVTEVTLVALGGPIAVLVFGVATIGVSAYARHAFEDKKNKKKSDIRSIEILIERKDLT